MEDTPEKAFLRSEVRRYANLQTASKKKIKTLQQSQRRLAQKVAHLQDVIKNLSENRILADEDVATLQSLGGSRKDLLMRQLARKSGAPLQTTYSPELRAFALTLHFYSPRAYRYVRAVFDTCLPHPKTLSKWYQSVDGAAGFSKEALTALEMKVQENSKKGYSTLCNLVVDEMAIRRHVEWDGKKFYGYADVGTKTSDDSFPIAKDAFVLMLVAINGRWKLPIGYFFVDGISGEQRCNLVQQAASLAHEKAHTLLVSLATMQPQISLCCAALAAS